MKNFKILCITLLPVIILILVSACSDNNSNGKNKDKLNDSINKANGDTALLSGNPDDIAGKFNYPVKTNFLVNLKPGQNYDTTFSLNKNKIRISFVPEGRSATKLWSVLRLWINSNEINLYDAPHGPGLDQAGLWSIGQENDFSEIIKTYNDNFPASLKTKLLSKTNHQAMRIEVNLIILGETSQADVINKYKKYIISKGIEDYWEGGYAKIQIVKGGYYTNNKTKDYFLSCFQGGGDYGTTYYHFYNSSTDKIYELNLEKSIPAYEINEISGIEPGVIHAKGRVAMYSSEKAWHTDLNIDFKIIDNTNIELNSTNFKKYSEKKKKLEAEVTHSDAESQYINVLPDAGNNLLNGLKLYWDFNQSSNNSFQDKISSTLCNMNAGASISEEGILNKCVYNDGSIGSGLVFGDHNKFVIRALSFWIKPIKLQQNQYILHGKLSNNTRTLINYKRNGNSMYLQTLLGNGAYYKGTDINLNIGTWYHIVITENDDAQTVYLNGQLKATTLGLNTLMNDKLDVLLRHQTNGYEANVQFDEFGIWDRKLAPTEVIQLYNNGLGLKYPFH